MKQIDDLTGKQFGKLTVIELAEPHISKGGQRRTAWLCKCSCGRERVVLASYLKRGSATYCGKCVRYVRTDAKSRACRFCKYSEWDKGRKEWNCLKGINPAKVTDKCNGYWCGSHDKLSGVKNRESKCIICGEPVYSHGRDTPIYCEAHRAYADLDDKAIKDAPLELLFLLTAGIFARARDDYIFNADNQRKNAELFLRSEWAQELSVRGFNVNELFERLDEDMINAINGTDQDTE